MSSISEVVASVVADHTNEVFALMGNGNAYFTEALARQQRVRMTALRHETACVASADAYYRVSRKIAVATTTFGPGYTNALTSLGEAVCAKTPLVFVVGGQPSTGPRPWDVDQVALAEAMGALALTVGPADAASKTREAFALATQHRKPVVLFIPFDLAQSESAEEYKPTPELPPSQAGPELQEADLKRIHRYLSTAEKPLILAGRGARKALPQLHQLADKIGALTVSTAPARGSFAGREYDLGVCGGFASEESSWLIKQADVVLSVGAAMNQFTTAFNTQFNDEAVIIRIDLADHLNYPRVDLLIEADAELAVSSIVDSLADHPTPELPWLGEAEHARSSQLNFAREVGTGSAEDGLLDPRTAVSRLNEILPKNRQVVSDGGHFIGWSSYYLDLPEPDSLVMVGTQYQSIGLGLPSAPGAILARPDALTTVFVGDGGGIMGLPDLDSIVRTAKRAVVVFFNDGCYGAEIHQYGAQGLDEEIMEIDQADFSALGRGFGADAVVVKTIDDLKDVQDWVQRYEGTLVVDLRISRSVVAPYIEEIRELTLKRK